MNGMLRAFDPRRLCWVYRCARLLLFAQAPQGAKHSPARGCALCHTSRCTLRSGKPRKLPQRWKSTAPGIWNFPSFLGCASASWPSSCAMHQKGGCEKRPKKKKCAVDGEFLPAQRPQAKNNSHVIPPPGRVHCAARAPGFYCGPRKVAGRAMLWARAAPKRRPYARSLTCAARPRKMFARRPHRPAAYRKQGGDPTAAAPLHLPLRGAWALRVRYSGLRWRSLNTSCSEIGLYTGGPIFRGGHRRRPPPLNLYLAKPGTPAQRHTSGRAAGTGGYSGGSHRTPCPAAVGAGGPPGPARCAGPGAR